MSKKFFIPEPRVFAHRGASGGYPENTLLSFREAVKIGVDVIETDVHFTKDGRFVVAHDGELGRICDGGGLVADHTLTELKKFDAGYGFSVDGGEKLSVSRKRAFSHFARGAAGGVPRSAVQYRSQGEKTRARCRSTAISSRNAGPCTGCLPPRSTP
ncbi:MAG: glycerophosphodiester phosphodiesterase [Spirochaetota bacterium]